MTQMNADEMMIVVHVFLSLAGSNIRGHSKITTVLATCKAPCDFTLTPFIQNQ